MNLIYTTLLLALALVASHAATITGGILAAADTTGTNARPYSVTITGSTNLQAGTLTATNSVTVGQSGTAGSLTLYDDDATAHHRRVAAATITTDINDIGPAAPYTGLTKRTITSTTNWTDSAAVPGTDYQAPFTTGAGVTNIANVLSANLGAGSNITLSTNTDGRIDIAGSASVSGANPTASVGLSAVNGVATTYLRSDGAPALSQAIVPTWTGSHTFTPSSGTAVTVNGLADTNAMVMSGSATGSSSNHIANWSFTLNTSANVDMFRYALTDTASGASSRFLWMGTAAGSPLFTVSKAGALFSSSSIISGANATGSGTISAVGLNFAGRGSFVASADGVFRAQDTAGTGFTSFQLGPTDASANTSSILGSGGSGTDIAGGLINLTGGASTGTGRGGAVSINTTPSGSTGTSANSASVRAYYSAKNVTLTEGADTVFANITVPTSGFVGATLSCTVFSGDGTDFQSLTSNLRVDAVNKAGTVTAAITQTDNTAAVSAGTLSCAYTAVALGASVSIRANPNSSFASPTALHVTWAITTLNSAGSPAVTAQ